MVKHENQIVERVGSPESLMAGLEREPHRPVVDGGGWVIAPA